MAILSSHDEAIQEILKAFGLPPTTTSFNFSVCVDDLPKVTAEMLVTDTQAKEFVSVLERYDLHVIKPEDRDGGSRHEDVR